MRREVYRAIVPGLATLPSAMLVGISSPYRKAGLLYEKWKAHFGKDSADVLMIQATSLQLNPTLDASLIERALEDDPVAARAEWEARWREDIASYVDLELIESAVDVGVKVRPPRPDISYFAAVDSASVVGSDRPRDGRHPSVRRDGLVVKGELNPSLNPSGPALRYPCG